MDSTVSILKTDTFRYRINPEIRQEIEEIFSKEQTDSDASDHHVYPAIINTGGLPFPVTADNAEFIRAKSMDRLMKKPEAGKGSDNLIEGQKISIRV